MTVNDPLYLPKDFIETADGLVFAVVQQGLDGSDGQAKALCFLRYLAISGKAAHRWQKLATDAANEYLLTYHPGYLYYSHRLDAHLHAVPVTKIYRHHQPKQRLQQLLRQPERDTIERDCYQLCQYCQQQGLDLSQFGVTGSLLLGAQQQSSDIDLVCYDTHQFHQARASIAKLVRQGKLSALSAHDWQEAYARRGCSLSFEEYVWHELRKFNKAIINVRKFDLSLINPANPNIASEGQQYHKQGRITLRVKVIDTDQAFDYPAVFKINQGSISEIVCFTATYTGQAQVGETVEVSGLLEQADNGEQRIVIGSSREAPGEYIKVVHAQDH